jgi:DNA repair exonuclease SbcCD ATPase subunit
MGELDAAGRQAFIEAIRSIQGAFKTIIVVSHIAEIQDAGWPVVARVTKEAGVSRVEVA